MYAVKPNGPFQIHWASHRFVYLLLTDCHWFLVGLLNLLITNVKLVMTATEQTEVFVIVHLCGWGKRKMNFHCEHIIGGRNTAMETIRCLTLVPKIFLLVGNNINLFTDTCSVWKLRGWNKKEKYTKVHSVRLWWPYNIWNTWTGCFLFFIETEWSTTAPRTLTFSTSPVQTQYQLC